MVAGKRRRKTSKLAKQPILPVEWGVNQRSGVFVFSISEKCIQFTHNRWFRFIEAGYVFRAYIAPVSEVPVAESAWVTVIDGEAQAWPPDGNLLYATSSRDGHWCIWAQRLHSTTRQRVGAPFAVFHSHKSAALAGIRVRAQHSGQQDGLRHGGAHRQHLVAGVETAMIGTLASPTKTEQG